MPKFPPDERTVYLAFKNVFKGPDTQPQSDKKIRKRIKKHESQSDEIRALVHEHNIDNVGNSVKALLDGDIFASTLKAKIRFPELFDVSPAQSAERAASEAEAVRSEIDAMRDVSGAQRDQTVSQSAGRAASETAAVNTEIHGTRDVGVAQQDRSVPTVVDGDAVAQKEQPQIHVPHVQRHLKPETFGARSLYPLYLPAKGQRRLLSKVQDVLEHACFRFAEGVMPQQLQQQGWDSPDCVELNCWMGMFRTRESVFDIERVTTLNKPFGELLSSIAQIRHTAVHRLKVTAGRVEAFLTDAETLAALLGDETCARQLSRLRRETHSVVEEFGRNKDLLEARYVDKRKEIAARRAELDRIEIAAWEAMLEEDKQYQCFAGVSLEEMVDVPETAFHSRANSEAGQTSEEETSVESESEPDFRRAATDTQGPLPVHVVKSSGPSL
ncbi:hypothetical protein E8E12_010787 [Didymella heteroderae]|uniref:Ubiquinol-cytochrome-c reductase cytochrome c1 n=1 Tax=Didymella heteroderae TaxID=1769908 RepID=A0A9P4WZQ3_9PLEO|nr:hypothetical protein E8E12_010787 [Didymella heteroderae]